MRAMMTCLIAPTLLAQRTPGSPLPQAVLDVELHQAALRHDSEHVKLVLARGAHVDSETPDGRTPLFSCAKHVDSTAVAKLLLGAKVELKDKSARTPPIVLAEGEKPLVVKGGQAHIKVGAQVKGDLDLMRAAENVGIDNSVPRRTEMEPFQLFCAYSNSPGAVPENLKPVQADAEDWVKTRVATNQIRVTPERLSLAAGTCTVFTADGRSDASCAVKWSIDENPRDASIDRQGVFSASRSGIYRIVATCASNPSLRGCAEVKVVNAVTETPVPAAIPKTHGGLTFIHLKGFRLLQVGGWDGSASMSHVVRWDGGEQASLKVIGNLIEPRISALGVALDTKKALICNGSTVVNGAVHLLRSVEVFDADSGESRPVPPAADSTTSTYFAHCGGSIVGLPGGRVLLFGGDDGNERCSGVELYDPQVDRFVLLDKAPFPTEASTVQLDDGRVLIFGGRYLSGKERGLSKKILSFEPKTGKFTKVGHMLVARAAHTSTALPDGKILIAGGCLKGWFGHDLSPTNRCEVYDPSSGKSEEVGSMSEPKAGHAAALMPTGHVLTYGGLSKTGGSPMPCTTLETFSYGEGYWRIFDHPRGGAVNPVLFILPDGKMFNGGSAVEFAPSKRDRPEDGVKPVPHLCDRVMM